MTGIIVNELEKSGSSGGSKFSLVDFYLSRARRIVPALLVLCVVLLVAGWFLLSAPEYKVLSVHAISALGFISNIKFWREDGYFDAASHEKLLLHTWSLSVEWQFYLMLPLVLLVVWKIMPGRKSLVVTMVSALVVSLLLSLVVTPIAPTAAFYLLPTRAWEMLAGGLVFLSSCSIVYSDKSKRCLESIGFLLIVASIIFFDADSIWPGWRALVPVVGTMLILAAARRASYLSGNYIVQRLGDYSYSLYLWHWPFVVGLVYLGKGNQPGAIVVGLVLTLVLGFLSYRFIEVSTRKSLSRMSKWGGTGALVVCVLVAVLLSFQIKSNQGIPGRLPAKIDAVFNEAENKNPRRGECQASGDVPVPGCKYGGDELGVIVIGDSHAAAVIRSIEKALPNSKLHVLDWTLNGCPTIAGIKKVNDSNFLCGDFVKQSLEKQKEFPSTVPIVIINRTDIYIKGPNELDRATELSAPPFFLSSPYATRSQAFLQEMREGIIETACEFAKMRPVYMVRPIPELKVDVPKAMGRALMLGHPLEVSISMEEYQARHAFSWETQDMAAERCGIKILDPLPTFCRDGLCRGNILPAGLPIYSDSNHLSERGGALLIPLFRQIFEKKIVQL